MKDIVKHSLEAKWRRGQIILYAVMWGVMIFISLIVNLVMMIPSNGHETFGTYIFAFIGCTVLFTVVFIPFVCFYLYQYLKLFYRYDGYEMHEVMLDKPSTSHMYRGAVYYTVSFVSNDNEKHSFETKPMWSSGAFSSWRIEDYNNKKVNILYNKERDCIIVVGLKGV